MLPEDTIGLFVFPVFGVIASLAFLGYTGVVHTIYQDKESNVQHIQKLKNWTFDVLGFVFFVLLEMFLYLIEVIDFFAKKKEQQCKTDM